MRFISEDHAQNFQNMILKDQIHPKDLERFALFYIIGGNEDLFSKRHNLYDFKEHSIKPECLTDGAVDLCSSSKALVRLAFNLYNGYEDEYTSPRDLLGNLDSKNHLVALHAMDLRFGRGLAQERDIEVGEEYEVELDF